MYKDIKILVVDDDDVILQIMKKYFSETDYNVVFCEDGLKAEEMISKEKFHIVVLDIVFPNVSGLEILKKIKKKNALVQVVMITGEKETDYIVEALENGATDYLLKPFDKELFMEVINDCVWRLRRWWSNLKQITQDKE